MKKIVIIFVMLVVISLIASVMIAHYGEVRTKIAKESLLRGPFTGNENFIPAKLAYKFSGRMFRIVEFGQSGTTDFVVIANSNYEQCFKIFADYSCGKFHPYFVSRAKFDGYVIVDEHGNLRPIKPITTNELSY